ncbi:unnamed protein product [Rotaria magnacalcarata]|nr:unnamed protein product [Rotaria magnacalcarata]
MKICTNNNLLNYNIALAKTDSKLTEEIQKLSLKVDYLLQQNKDRLKSELDCWDTTSDSKKLCFLCDLFAGNLRVKILCNDLIQTFIVDDAINRKNFNELRTFNDIDNAVLQLPPNIFPYRRLLNWHGRCSFKTAKANKWINKDEHLEYFFHLSDLISLPGED